MNLKQKVKVLEGQLAEALEVIARQQQRIAQLEAQLAVANKDSSNSSKPPSSDITKPPRGGSSSPRKIGGQPGHPRHDRKPFAPDQIDKRRIHKLRQCPECGSRDLERLDEPAQVVQQVELLPKPFRVTEHVIEACRCRGCQRVQTGRLPPPVAATGLIGSRMMGLLLYMKGAMRISYSGLEEFLHHVLGFKVSRGYLAKVMVRGSQALRAPVEELRAQLPLQPWLNVDETGHKENGQGMWTWCFRAPGFVLFTIQDSRGSDVLLEFLGVQFNGLLGCDYFSAYRKFMGQMSGSVQFCLAHLVRDLKFLAEHPDPRIQLYGQPILRAVGRMFHLIHQQVEKPVARFETKLQRCKKQIIDLATNTAALSPIDWYVEKNYPAVRNMARRFRKHGESYFSFITTPGIGPTNNAAEQALRFVVMDRKATQGTRSHKGRTFCERIWTVVGTCRMNKQSIFDYLCRAMQARAKGLPPPSLIVPDTS